MGTGKIFLKPGVFDAMSAKIMEDCGFQVIGLSGYSLSVASLAKPDMGFTTLDDIIFQTERITAAVMIPLIVDVDTGFGNALNVLHTTERVIRAGAAAFHMEDQEFPKRCASLQGKAVISREEMVGKIRAAVRVRDEMDKDFVIIARCDARTVAGGTLENVIDRCKAYMDAGADMIFPSSLLSKDEIVTLAEKVNVPLHLNRGGKMSAKLSLQELSTIKNVVLVSQASGPIMAAIAGMYEWGQGTMKDDLNYVNAFSKALKYKSFGDLHQFAGAKQYMALEKEYLPEAFEERYVDANA